MLELRGIGEMSLYVLKYWEGGLEEMKEYHSLAQKRKSCIEISLILSETSLPKY